MEGGCTFLNLIKMSNKTMFWTSIPKIGGVLQDKILLILSCKMNYGYTYVQRALQ